MKAAGVVGLNTRRSKLSVESSYTAADARGSKNTAASFIGASESRPTDHGRGAQVMSLDDCCSGRDAWRPSPK